MLQPRRPQAWASTCRVPVPAPGGQGTLVHGQLLSHRALPSRPEGQPLLPGAVSLWQVVNLLSCYKPRGSVSRLLCRSLLPVFTQQMVSGICPGEGWKSHEGKRTGEQHPTPKSIPCPFVLGLLDLPRRQGRNGQARSWGSAKGCFCPLNAAELGGCLPSPLNCFLSSFGLLRAELLFLAPACVWKTWLVLAPDWR